MSDSKPVNMLEEGSDLQLDFGKVAKIAKQCSDVIPVAVQDADNKEIILVAYINQLALEESIKTKIATFWSTSRNELWIKGKTSGQYFILDEIRVNCEQNSLVFIVHPKGKPGICHTKNQSGEARNCYYRRLNLDSGKLENLDS